MYKKKEKGAPRAGSSGDALGVPPDTRHRLVECFRQLANEHGLEAIGARELARSLALSPGNVSYHFPKKEDLVRAAMAELRADNAAALSALPVGDTMPAFVARLRVMMENQLRWRCLPRALVHVVEAFPEIGAEYRATERARRDALREALVALRARGELDASFDDAAAARVVATCSLVARFWLSEQRLSFPEVPEIDLVAHYLSLVAQALLPHATAKGRRGLAPVLAGVRIQGLSPTPAR